VFVFEDDTVREEGARRRGSDAHVHSFSDLPRFNGDAYALAEEDHPGRVLVVVHEVEENDALHEDVCEDGAHTRAHIVFLLAPVRDVVLEGKHFEDHVQHADYSSCG